MGDQLSNQVATLVYFSGGEFGHDPVIQGVEIVVINPSCVSSIFKE